MKTNQEEREMKSWQGRRNGCIEEERDAAREGGTKGGGERESGNEKVTKAVTYVSILSPPNILCSWRGR